MEHPQPQGVYFLHSADLGLVAMDGATFLRECKRDEWRRIEAWMTARPGGQPIVCEFRSESGPPVPIDATRERAISSRLGLTVERARQQIAANAAAPVGLLAERGEEP